MMPEKKRIKNVLLLFLFISACGDEKQIIYSMGSTLKIGNDYSICVTHYDVEQYFKVEAITENDKHVSYFNFGIHENKHQIYDNNPDYFVYETSDFDHIEFDEKGYFEFYGAKTFYIYYSQSPDYVKEAISSFNYTIYTLGNGWYDPRNLNIYS